MGWTWALDPPCSDSLSLSQQPLPAPFLPGGIRPLCAWLWPALHKLRLVRSHGVARAQEACAEEAGDCVVLTAASQLGCRWRIDSPATALGSCPFSCPRHELILLMTTLFCLEGLAIRDGCKPPAGFPGPVSPGSVPCSQPSPHLASPPCFVPASPPIPSFHIYLSSGFGVRCSGVSRGEPPPCPDAMVVRESES